MKPMKPMKRTTREFLSDIDQNIERAIDFVKDLDFDQFCQDQKTLYAVVRAIEILGEAVKNIPDGICEQYPEVNDFIMLLNHQI